jgi:1-deoxy-D-xylulose-5-phosphate reductoisomerase
LKNPTNIAILGSTGSIGCSSLEVIANFPDELRATYLTANKNIDLLQKQIRHFRPRGVVVLEESSASALRKTLDGTTEILSGEEGLQEIVCREDVDIVLSSLVGFAGLKPTLCAIEAGKDIALANKETLVVGGEIIMKKVRKHGVRLLPIDSEHSAILQCIQGENTDDIVRVILTASGGPFLHMNMEQFENVTVEQALNHPTWKMGNKITIDSATLMNKGLEVIEAFWLFGLPSEKIEILVHPQSIIHSIVEFADGSMKAQLSIPDMKIPIQYALMYPRRPATSYKKIDFNTLREMTFLRPDTKKFPCLPLAFKALEMGGTATAVLNAANEVAVQMFLEEQLSFASIPAVIQDALSSHTPVHNARLEDVVNADIEAREHVRHLAVAIH